MGKYRSRKVHPTPSPDALKNLLYAARDELTTETRLARAGLDALNRYSDRVDELVRLIFGNARKCTETPLALLALGGYGRKQLCLHSDIDLMVVFDGAIGVAEERSLKSLLHPLWDLHFDVGHQVRVLGDFENVETDNPEYLVALLDARFLDGDQAIFDHFSETCLGENPTWQQPIRSALLDLTEQRHVQYNQTLYQLEPDLKDSPGALRDASAVRLLARLGNGNGTGRRASDTGRLSEAEDFLLRIRSILHLERGRNLNTLSHELQETVADLFGSSDEQPRRQVEALMSTYFHHARIISRSLAASLKSLGTPVTVLSTPINDDLARAWDGIRFTDATRASLRPRTWLRVFEVALDENTNVSEQVLTCIERHGERYAPERFFPSPAERDLFLRILRPRPGLYARLSEMHDSGLLGRMFPEFQKIYCRVIRDFYHKYTVDEHTLLTIRTIERLCAPANPSRERFASLLTELRAPELLVLALLFHDVGKWTNKNHAEESVRMAVGALRRIKLPESAVTTVQFLIRHHLQMSTVAFRRDMEDPEVVNQFARLVGTEQRLKLLCLLTLVDIEAVGPDVMTPWKEEMLWRLYVDTYNRLTLGYGDEVIDTTAAAIAELTTARPDDISEQDMATFLAGLPQRYLRLFEQSRVYEHVRLSRDIKRSEVHCALEEKGSAWELSVVSINQPRLFSNICGVLSYFGMDILRGQAMTNEHGLVLDVVQFADTESFFRLNPSAKPELVDLLQDVVAGRADITQTLRGKERGLAPRGPSRINPIVHFDRQYSDRYTILELIARDAWGLLYRTSRVISQHGFDIELVLITTEGNRAIDVFHITHHGVKLSAASERALATDLDAMLGKQNEDDQGDRSSE